MKAAALSLVLVAGAAGDSSTTKQLLAERRIKKDAASASSAACLRVTVVLWGGPGRYGGEKDESYADSLAWVNAWKAASSDGASLLRNVAATRPPLSRRISLRIMRNERVEQLEVCVPALSS